MYIEDAQLRQEQRDSRKEQRKQERSWATSNKTARKRAQEAYALQRRIQNRNYIWRLTWDEISRRHPYDNVRAGGFDDEAKDTFEEVRERESERLNQMLDALKDAVGDGAFDSKRTINPTAEQFALIGENRPFNLNKAQAMAELSRHVGKSELPRILLGSAGGLSEESVKLFSEIQAEQHHGEMPKLGAHGKWFPRISTSEGVLGTALGGVMTGLDWLGSVSGITTGAGGAAAETLLSPDENMALPAPASVEEYEEDGKKLQRYRFGEDADFTGKVTPGRVFDAVKEGAEGALMLPAERVTGEWTGEYAGAQRLNNIGIKWTDLSRRWAKNSFPNASPEEQEAEAQKYFEGIRGQHEVVATLIDNAGMAEFASDILFDPLNLSKGRAVAKAAVKAPFQATGKVLSKADDVIAKGAGKEFAESMRNATFWDGALQGYSKGKTPASKDVQDIAELSKMNAETMTQQKMAKWLRAAGDDLDDASEELIYDALQDPSFRNSPELFKEFLTKQGGKLSAPAAKIHQKFAAHASIYDDVKDIRPEHIGKRTDKHGVIEVGEIPENYVGRAVPRDVSDMPDVIKQEKVVQDAGLPKSSLERYKVESSTSLPHSTKQIKAYLHGIENPLVLSEFSKGIHEAGKRLGPEVESALSKVEYSPANKNIKVTGQEVDFKLPTQKQMADEVKFGRVYESALGITSKIAGKAKTPEQRAAMLKKVITENKGSNKSDRAIEYLEHRLKGNVADDIINEMPSISKSQSARIADLDEAARVAGKAEKLLKEATGLPFGWADDVVRVGEKIYKGTRKVADDMTEKHAHPNAPVRPRDAPPITTGAMHRRIVGKEGDAIGGKSTLMPTAQRKSLKEAAEKAMKKGVSGKSLGEHLEKINEAIPGEFKLGTFMRNILDGVKGLNLIGKIDKTSLNPIFPVINAAGSVAMSGLAFGVGKSALNPANLLPGRATNMAITASFVASLKPGSKMRKTLESKTIRLRSGKEVRIKDLIKIAYEDGQVGQLAVLADRKHRPASTFTGKQFQKAGEWFANVFGGFQVMPNKGVGKGINQATNLVSPGFWSDVSENFQHLMVYANSLEGKTVKGKTVFTKLDRARAAKKANTFTANYRQLNWFEKQVMKDTMYFYPWTRKVIPLIAKGVAENPQVVAKYMAYRGHLQEENGKYYPTWKNTLPEWAEITGLPANLESQLGLLRDGKYTDEFAYTVQEDPLNMALPLAVQMADWAEGKEGSSKDVRRMLAPSAVLLSEIITGTNLTTGKPIKRTGAAGKAVENLFSRAILPSLAAGGVAESLGGDPNSYMPSKAARNIMALYNNDPEMGARFALMFGVANNLGITAEALELIVGETGVGDLTSATGRDYLSPVSRTMKWKTRGAASKLKQAWPDKDK